MGVFQDIIRLATKVEDSQHSSSNKKLLNSLQVEPDKGGYSVQKIALVKDENLWELDDEVKLVPGERTEFHWNSTKKSDDIIVSTRKPVVERDDWFFFIDRDYQIINAQKAQLLLNF